MSKGYSGINADEISVEDVRRGDINLDDIRIHPDTLLSWLVISDVQRNSLVFRTRKYCACTRHCGLAVPPCKNFATLPRISHQGVRQ